MGFYFRVAPGLRFRLTQRGIRASIGPRAARLHIGAGGPGVSTGAGPVSYYHSLSGVGRPAPRGREAKLLQAQQINAIWQHLLDVHREDFPPAQPPVIPRDQVIELDDLIRKRERESVRGISWFRRRQRKQALADAEVRARQEWEQANAAADAQQMAEQAQADQWWRRLLANDPETVMAGLSAAFDDNDAPAAPLGIEGGEVSIALLAPAEEVIPIRMGRMTDAGNISLAKLSKGDRGQLITSITLGYLLVTLRETFAVAPGLESARVVIVRVAGSDAYGSPRLECLAAGRWTKERLIGVRWQEVDAGTIAIDTAEELMLDIRGGAPRVLNLADEPAIRDLIAAIDTSTLVEDPPAAATQGT